jgi:hypothetical protein
MIGFDNSNLNASRVRYGRWDVDWKWLHPFRIHVQHVNNQVRGFFCRVQQISTLFLV